MGGRSGHAADGPRGRHGALRRRGGRARRRGPGLLAHEQDRRVRRGRAQRRGPAGRRQPGPRRVRQDEGPVLSARPRQRADGARSAATSPRTRAVRTASSTASRRTTSPAWRSCWRTGEVARLGGRALDYPELDLSGPADGQRGHAGDHHRGQRPAAAGNPPAHQDRAGARLTRSRPRARPSRRSSRPGWCPRRWR